MIIRDYLDGWNETNEYKVYDESCDVQVSIIVAAYNEESSILECVQSILRNNYNPEKFELIVVDNGSTDSTWHILKSINSKNLIISQQPDGYKKEALEVGMEKATGEFILWTDADSIVGPMWIQSMVTHYEIHQASMVLGPVRIGRYFDLITRFQAFDMLAMMGVTAGGIRNQSTYLANGANLGFARETFDSIGAIPRKDIASGDDVFLLQAFAAIDPTSIYYNRSKEAIVQTQAVYTLKKLIQQRIRWASKSMSYVHNKDRFIAMFIFIFCLSIAINLALIPLTSGLSFYFALFQLFIKGVLDYFFLERVNDFFRLKHLMKYFIPSFIIHFVYILFAGFTGIIRPSYEWRGKRII